MKLNNLMEHLVEQKLDSVLVQYPNCCKCQRCRQDIMAYALNHIPPKYVCTEKGDLFVRLAAMQGENEISIIREIAIAVEKIAPNPRH